MKNRGPAIAALIAFLALPLQLIAADVTVTIDSKVKGMLGYKVVVKGVLKLDKGETWGGLAGYILNEDDGETKVNATFVSLAPPEKQEDGTFKDGSYEWYAVTPTEGSWVAWSRMTYMNAKQEPKEFPAGKGFTLP